ncbi:MAG TPA: delta-60 repeat domain-containing protein [Solirubrobacterales bacterium]|nr:delta-60 repeat domain-containing protein [Solirubrobacterales bacterium]
MSRPPRRLLLVLATLVALAAAPAADAAPGDLDPTFGSGGQLRLLESEEDSFADAVAIQPDGKIVIAGSDHGNAVVLRRLPDGSPDPSFGSGGTVTTAVSEFGEFRAVTIQPDGKIVAAGSAKGTVNRDFLIARYSTDGAPDGSFGGGDGQALVPVGAEGDDAKAVAIGTDGRIVAVGEAGLSGGSHAAGIVVLQSSGVPDPGFGGGDGVVVKETAGKFDTAVAVAPLGDGSIIVGDINAVGGGLGFVLLKLRSDGEYDNGFGGGDGISLTPIPVEGAMTASGFLKDLTMLSDGRIVAGGAGLDYYGTPPTYHPKVVAVRYLSDGELDPSFGSDGIFTYRGVEEPEAETLDLAAGGGYLLAGRYYNGSLKQQASLVVRLTSGGALDPAFGAGGIVARGDTAPFGEGIAGAAVDSEDRLLTIGTAYGPNNTSWASVARYLGDREPAKPISAPVNRAPHARMKAVPKKVKGGKLKAFSGVAADPDGNGIGKVEVALVRIVPGGAKAKASAGKPRCFALRSPKPRFEKVKPKGNQCPQRWLKAKGKAKWSFKLKRALPPGRYLVLARATDGLGVAETGFSRKLRNRYAFRVLPER